MIRNEEKEQHRLLPVDALRGLIIVLMALDHANYFVAQQHSTGEYWGGPFPTYDHVIPFLTRFVTHFCAPGFFFLMGVGMTLFAESRQARGWGVRQIQRHFWLRGAILMALQLLVVNRAWEASPGGWDLFIYIGVLFALGLTMIFASFLLWIKPGYLVAIILGLLIATELLVPNPESWGRSFSIFQHLFLFAGGDAPGYWVNYPAFSWLELVVFGCLFGRWLYLDRRLTYRRGLYLGSVIILVFLLLRALDGFGNLRPRAGNTLMDFLNPVKYPPSITFTMLTTGVNLLLLSLFSWIAKRWSAMLQPLSVYGRTPLFFYMLHLFLYAAIGHLFAPRGTSLTCMYLFWLIGLLILYPLCLWYAGFKTRKPGQSVFHFF